MMFDAPYRTRFMISDTEEGGVFYAQPAAVGVILGFDGVPLGDLMALRYGVMWKQAALLRDATPGGRA